MLGDLITERHVTRLLFDDGGCFYFCFLGFFCLFGFIYLFYFALLLDRVSCCSSLWHWTHYLDQGGCESTEICLPYLMGLKDTVLSFKGYVKGVRKYLISM